MTRASKPFRILLLCATCVALLAFWHDALWSASPDLIAHYALVTQVADSWSLAAGPIPARPAAGAAHLVAALAGGLLGSRFLGMHLLGLLAFGAVWAVLAQMLASLPRARALAAALLLFALLLLNRFGWQVPVFGHEIAGPYLFSQLFAQALALGALGAALLHERGGAQRPAATRWLLLGVGIVATGCADLLPALELLGALLVLLAVDCAERRAGARAALAALILAALALVLACVRHPAWRALLAGHISHASLALAHAPSPRALALEALFVLGVSLALVRGWLRLDTPAQRLRHAALKYLGAFGLALAVLGLLHLLALKTGRVAPVAVPPWLFALDSFALLDLALLPVLFVLRAAPAPQAHPWLARLHRLALAPLLLAGAAACIAPRVPVASATRVAALEHQLELLRLAALPASDGTHDYVAALAQMPPAVNAMLTRGVLHTPADDLTLQLAAGAPVRNLCALGSLIVTRGAPGYGGAACARPGAASALLTALDGACVRAAQPEATLCGASYDFTAHGQLDGAHLEGFGEAEEHGRWTLGTQARFVSHAAVLQRARTLVLDTHAFVPNSHVQHLQLRINGHDAGQFVYDSAHETRLLRIALPAPAGPMLQVDFVVPDAVAPKTLGLSADARTLAVAVRSLSFE